MSAHFIPIVHRIRSLLVLIVRTSFGIEASSAKDVGVAALRVGVETSASAHPDSASFNFGRSSHGSSKERGKDSELHFNKRL